MRLIRLAAAAGLTSLCLTTPSPAHDFGSGPNFGGPPKARVVKNKLMDLMPAEVNTAAAGRVRGVIDRAKMWPQDTLLTVCYLSGTQKARVRISDIASEWTKHVGLRFDFGDPLSPRTCGGLNSEHIKVDFFSSGPNAGHWSYVGIDSRSFAHSMNLNGYGSDALPVPEAEYRSIVLHEFGHALGFEHEHQSPAAMCEAEFDKVKVTEWAGRMSWSEDDVKTNLAQLEPTATRVFTRHDTKSIMHYSLPEELLKGGKTNKCWVEKNKELSQGDKDFAASIYPQRVASLGSGGGGTRGVTGSGGTRAAGIPAASAKDAEARYRAGLVRDYQDALAKSGVEGARAESLTAEFKAELARVRDAKPAAARAKKN
jgi:Astacin (Peptidase family M12A)